MDTTSKLEQQWENGAPDSEWSTHTAEGQILYYAAYSEGVVLHAAKREPIFINAETARRLATRIFRDFGATETGRDPFAGAGPVAKR